MVLFRVIIGTLWVSILLIGRGLSSSDPYVPRISIEVRPGAPFSGLHIDEHGIGQPAGQRLDIHGNPVEPAVGDYRTDPRGDIYEWHAPDTAILKLAPPGV